MLNEFWGPFTAVGGTLAFFGGIGLLMWIDYKGKAREKELAHAERLKALETGQALPDAEVARSGAEASRAWAAGLTTVTIVLGMAGAAVGATAMVFTNAAPSIHLPLSCVVWGVCGAVGLTTVSLGFAAMRQKSRAIVRESQTNLPVKHRNTEAIRAADAPASPMG